MNRLTRMSLLGALSSLPMVVYSVIPKKPDPPASMHPDDFPPGDEAMKPRRFRSMGHIYHHVKELMDLNLYALDVYAFRGLPAKFRESIMMRTAMVNNCLAWGFAHEAFGRIAGLKDEDVTAIRKLDKSKLDPREYIALCWVDEFLTFPSGPTEETDRLFNDTFSEKDRLRITATMKIMFMANLSSNTFESIMNQMCGVDDRKREVSCSL